MRAIAAAALVFFSLTAGSEAKCLMNRFTFHLGNDVSTTGATDGARCTIRLNNSRDPIYGTKVISPPRGGVATVNGRTTVIYQPKAGFKGEDKFAFQWVGKERGITPMAATINVSVTVN
jgi:hypothetical protein